MQTVDISLQWDDTLTQQKGLHQYSQITTLTDIWVWRKVKGNEEDYHISHVDNGCFCRFPFYGFGNNQR